MMIDNNYIWFPIILILQAISFCLPNAFWQYFGNQADCNYIIDICYNASREDTNNASIRKAVARISKFFNNKISFKITSVYLLTKFITIIICFLNLFFLWDRMFQKDYFYALNTIKSVGDQ